MVASPRVKPQLAVPSSGKVLRRAIPKQLSKASGPIFNRLTVVWVQTNGVPFDTTGFFARLTRNNQSCRPRSSTASALCASTILAR